MAKIAFYVPFISMVIGLYLLFAFYFLRKVELSFEHLKLSKQKRIRSIFGIFVPLMVLILFRKMDSTFSPLVIIGCYIWISYLFLFFFWHGSFDILWMIIFKITKRKLSFRTLFLVFNLFCVVVLFWGFFEAKKIMVTRVELSSDKLKEGVSYKLIQITDVHFSAVNKVSFARDIVELVNRENADIIVSTGDLIDRGMNSPDQICQTLKQLKAKMGKFAVTGNHDYYYGIKEAIAFHENCEITLLQNQTIKIGDITLVGINDKTAKRFYKEELPTEKELLKDLEGYKVYLKHQPEVAKEDIKYFDLMLSGHTHAGQIFPFGLFVDLKYDYFKGLYKINQSHIYVSRGTGTWGPPIRFMAPPEITVINIKGTGK